MKYILQITAMLLLIFGSNNNLSAQSHIDNNYNYGTGSGTYLLKGPGNTEKDYITLSVNNDKVTVSGRIFRMNGIRIQGNYSGKIGNDGIIHGTVTWSVAPDNLKKATYFQLYKSSGSSKELVMAFYDNTTYKTNSRIRPKSSITANSVKEGTSTTTNTSAANTTKRNTTTTAKNDKVKVRVDYKFIHLSPSFAWDKTFLNYTLTDKATVQLYGTGSIRAYSETSSGTTELKAIGNAPSRVFDIPKSRPSSKHNNNYYDSKKNRSWGGNYDDLFGFYSFAKDAEMPKSKEIHSNPAIFPVNKRLEFEVNRAALEGKTERVTIDGHAHLSNRLPGGDVTFGNIHRKVYLHELTNQSKLSKEEKIYNRKLEGKGHTNAGTLVDAPYYFFAIKRGEVLPAVMIAFTVEVIE